LAALLAKSYEVDPFLCPWCGGEMKVIAVIMDPVEVEKILKHLVKTGKSPPGVSVESSTHTLTPPLVSGERPGKQAIYRKAILLV